MGGIAGVPTGRFVFVTGGTGYIGRAVIRALLARGHQVRALVRAQSAARLPAGCEAIVGDALDRRSFQDRIAPADTLLQLVGTPNPSPRFAAEFERVDFVSARESAIAASSAAVRHLVYVSVAQPAPVMRAYTGVRARGETLMRESGVPATILRPWYVLGPGHRWPCLLLPVYGLFWIVPASRPTVRRLGLITLGTMVRALVAAVELPSQGGTRVWDVEEIRRQARSATKRGAVRAAPSDFPHD